MSAWPKPVRSSKLGDGSTRSTTLESGVNGDGGMGGDYGQTVNRTTAAILANWRPAGRRSHGLMRPGPKMRRPRSRFPEDLGRATDFTRRLQTQRYATYF